jgi:hypothetical protein
MKNLIVTLVACCATGCIAEEQPEKADPVDRLEASRQTLATKNLPANLVDQLEVSKQTLAAKGLPIHLISYAAAGALDTDDAVRSVKTQLVADNVMVPEYDGMEPASFRLSTIHERMQAPKAANEDEQDVVSNIQSNAFPSIKVGQKTLDVMWESQGRQFQTKLVYDDNGVVYDNMLSNIAFIEVTQLPTETPPQPTTEIKDAKDANVAARRNRSWSTRFLDTTIKWAWGATRGKIQMSHYVISCDGWHSFCDAGGDVTAWMSLGNAAGKTHQNALRKPRISKLAWGYGWATPTASFKITWKSKSGSFDVGTSGVGSAGKGSGIHTIY